VSDLDTRRSIHRPVLVTQSSFIEGLHVTKNTASGLSAIKQYAKLPYKLLCFVKLEIKHSINVTLQFTLGEQSVRVMISILLSFSEKNYCSIILKMYSSEYKIPLY
jgi:hypothetical protein